MINTFNSQQGNDNGALKLSLMYIEQAYYYRIQIKSLASIYKLNVKIKKPIILSLYSLAVLKYIIDHSQALNCILQMENIHQIKISVPGYGVFKQKYQLQKISNLFHILASYCQDAFLSIKKIALQFPGWRSFGNDILSNIFKFTKKCQVLQQFSLNINHVMNLSINGIFLEEDYDQMNAIEEETFYGKYLFNVKQFNFLMKCLEKDLPDSTMTKIQLGFGAWESVSSSVLESLIGAIKKIYETMKNIKVIKLDLNGWGTGSYESVEKEMRFQLVEKLFRTIEEFDNENSQLLEIDMRHWPSKYNINKFKDEINYLSGVKRKDEGMASMGTSNNNFFGSHLKVKLSNTIKIQIKD